MVRVVQLSHLRLEPLALVLCRVQLLAQCGGAPLRSVPSQHQPTRFLGHARG